MRPIFVVLLIFGMVAVSGAAFANSISDVVFVSGKFTLSGQNFNATILEDGSESVSVPIKRLFLHVAVVLKEADGTHSDVIFSQSINGVRTLTFCSDPSCVIPRGDKVYTLKETGKTQFIGNYFGVAAGYITIQSDVPEPGTVLLFGTGLAGLVPVVRRKLRI
jgi:hypothetical protein